MIFNEQERTLKIREKQKYMRAIKVFTLVSLFVSFAILIAATVLALTPTSFELDSSNVTRRVGF
jgi:cell division septal protein FtsQ